MNKTNLLFLDSIHKAFDTATKFLSSKDKMLREKYLNNFLDKGIPSSQDESWRFSSLTDIGFHAYKLPINHKYKEEIPEEMGAFLSTEISSKIFIHFNNGILNPSDFEKLQKIQGLNFALKTTTTKEDFFENNIKSNNSLADLSFALCEKTYYFDISSDFDSSTQIYFIYTFSHRANAGMFYPRLKINIQEGAVFNFSQSVIVDKSINTFIQSFIHVSLARNARFYHAHLQAGGKKARQIHDLTINQKTSSQSKIFSFDHGGQIYRKNISVNLQEEHATTELVGSYNVSGYNHIDHTLDIQHISGKTTSHQLYKGLLHGHCKAAFRGKVKVHKNASESVSTQLNKNLLMSNNARINTIPLLLIDNDDVKCTHGATNGQLNPDEVFYLMSRGIGKNKALRLLAQGFLSEVLMNIPQSGMKEIVKKFMLDADTYHHGEY